MNNLKISIIIPAYNAAAFIEKTLDSILAQTLDSFEVVVVNDGSKDDTPQILKRYAEKDERIRVFSQENSGVSAARNTALAQVKGEFITCVDADDSLPETALEDMLALMTDDVDFVIGSHTEIRILKDPHIETPRTYTPEEIQEHFIDYDSVIWWPWGKLFRTSIIRDNGLQYDTGMTFGEDHIFNLLYSKYITKKVVISEKSVYNYHFIRGGLCSKIYPNMNQIQKYLFLKVADVFGGTEALPYEYKRHFVSSNLKYLTEYYIAYTPFAKAVEKVRESFALYSDLTDDTILGEVFTQEQLALVKKGDYTAFCKDYIKHNPRQTLWRKFRRTVRRGLEFGQKIILKRK